MVSEHQLYIGVNYHPHDWPAERWPADIALMKQAGVDTVRLGHLCWDSFEPEDGVYTFGWFDHVMDLFAEAGIGVFLDVTTRPAPAWVHKLCPGCNVVSASGAVQHPLRRYMEDVADPDYQRYALRFAGTLVRRYRSHPALFAFGLCNELGDGYFSFSEASRLRFADWLRDKYGTVDAWNKAWAAQRWSRRQTSFEDAVFPINEVSQGSPEALLDMRRFFSDGYGRFITRLKETVEKEAPGIPHSSNHYAEKKEPGFDYLKYCRGFVDFPGMGIYPGAAAGAHDDANMTWYHHRLAETGKPMWCLEFQTGCKGLHHPKYGLNRMYALLMLLHSSQMTLAWTWRSMYGGEEQFLYGLLDHDGTPNVNYREFRQIAADYRKLEARRCFPYLPHPQIAVAYSRESDWQCQYAPQQFPHSHVQSVQAVVHAVMADNDDFNIVDLRHMEGEYRLLIVPAVSIMDEASADAIRTFVRNGGTVCMTAQSAVCDETSKAFTTPRPGRLEDVFGLRIAGFERPSSAVMPASVSLNGQIVPVQPEIVETIELRGAAPLAADGTGACMLSVNSYGKGTAMYLALEPEAGLMKETLRLLRAQLGLAVPPETPEGVQARQTADGEYFYVNTTSEPKKIRLNGAGRGILREAALQGEFELAPLDAEYVVMNEN